MTLDDLLFAALPLLVLAALLAHDIRKRLRRRADARRAAFAKWIRETPFSVRAGLTPEEMTHMSANEIDQFMRPEDMSAVRREIEELEKTEEFQSIKNETVLRQRRLGMAPPAPRIVVARPTTDDLTDEEREILEATDARMARR